MWFPCLNSPSELCTWKIEVTLESASSTAAPPAPATSAVEANTLECAASGQLVHVEHIDTMCASPSAPTSTTTLTSTSTSTATEKQVKTTTRNKYHFMLATPTCAANIGLAIGTFQRLTIRHNLTANSNNSGNSGNANSGETKHGRRSCVVSFFNRQNACENVAFSLKLV